MFSNIYQPWTYLKTGNIIWVRCTFCHVLLTVQNTRRRALLFIDNRQFIGFLHKQNWVVSTDINLLSLIGLWWNIKRCLQFRWNSNFQLIYIFFFFHFSVAIDSGEILKSAWQEEGNFEVLKRSYIQIYPTSFLLCYGKAVNLRAK